MDQLVSVKQAAGLLCCKDDKRYEDVWSERFAGRTLDEITPAELEKVRTERLKAPPPPKDEKERPKKAISPATVNREFAFLKHAYNIAVRDGKTVSNPVAKLKMLRESSGRVRHLSDEEQVQLMKALSTAKGSRPCDRAPSHRLSAGGVPRPALA